MRKFILTSIAMGSIVFNSFGWGLTGHRVVGEIASYHLSKKAAKSIQDILGPESLAMVANWMDEIKSDPSYNYLNSWHYLTVKAGKGYDPSIQEKSGDAYGKTKMIIAALKMMPSARKIKRHTLKCLYTW